MKITILEWIIIISITLILVGIINDPDINNDTICKAGYLFATSPYEPDIQIINEYGTGIKCQ